MLCGLSGFVQLNYRKEKLNMFKVNSQKGNGKEWFAENSLFVSLDEAGKMFGVCTRTIRRLAQNGKFKMVKVGHSVRICRQSIIDYISKIRKD